MAFHLMVISPFGEFEIGDRITEAAEVEQHSDSQNVVRVSAPDEHAQDKQEG